MPLTQDVRADAGQASAEAIGLTVLVALLLAALAAWLPAAISLPDRPPAVIERLGALVGLEPPQIHGRASRERHRRGIRPGANLGVSALTLGSAAVATTAQLAKRVAAPVADSLTDEHARAVARGDDGRAIARLLRGGLGGAAVPDPTFDLATRIARLRDLVVASIERFMWFKNVGRFIGAAGIDGSFDWNDDGCSYVPDFSFRAECSHHDFAYRNAKALGVFDNDIKGTADDQLRREIAAQCAQRRRISRYVCRGWSVTVWAGVRLFG